MKSVPKPAVRAEGGLQLSRAASSIRQSPLRDVMGLIHRAGALSFAHGLPARELVPGPILARLAPDLLDVADVDTCTLSQGLIATFFDSGGFPLHLRRLRREYRARRDAMLAALDRRFAGTALVWNRPTAGMFVWMELPEPRDMPALLRSGIEEEGVAFSPGLAFTVKRTAHADRTLRLAFSSLAVDEIEEGVERLARVFRRAGVVG